MQITKSDIDKAIKILEQWRDKANRNGNRSAREDCKKVLAVLKSLAGM